MQREKKRVKLDNECKLTRVYVYKKEQSKSSLHMHTNYENNLYWDVEIMYKQHLQTKKIGKQWRCQLAKGLIQNIAGLSLDM